MDGKEALYRLRQLLHEDADSSFLDDKTSYSFLWEAAKAFVTRTNCLRSSQSITTVVDQAGYTINADFLRLYLKDNSGNFIVKYNNGSANDFIPYRKYSQIIYEDNTTSSYKPNYFTIIDDPTLDSQVSGTASSAGASSGGLSTLTDTSSSTKFADVSAGDIVHNVTDGADGIVVSKTSGTAVVTALFGGSGNDWASSDSYVIQPQGRLQLQLNPPPSVAGHTVTLYYIQIPPPVYSVYGTYRFSQSVSEALVKYAAWLWKYADREPNFGDKWYTFFDLQARQYVSLFADSINQRDFDISFRKR